MTTILNQVGLYTYENYMKQFNQWVHKGHTSSKDTSPALVEFTKLNWARTQRLHKTILLNPEIKKSAEKMDHIYTWMVLTEAWCGDSAQNLPVIAEIAKLNPEKIKLYIVLRDKNPELMSKYLTDGAQAIPKLIALDDTLGKEVFT
ncbi:MAG: thioredoxin family protein, partial [Ginsengibacter sp.]